MKEKITMKALIENKEIQYSKVAPKTDDVYLVNNKQHTYTRMYSLPTKLYRNNTVNYTADWTLSARTMIPVNYKHINARIEERGRYLD